ncbi:MAG TPA: hypothetical protein VMO26_08195 [Vicinamibacterales bacterium]|nr:hypothetical protein [Vicinamibacterales bacterium]
MKTILVATLLAVVVPSLASAQQTQALWSARGHHVAVIDADRREWQGRLLDIAGDAIVVEIDSAPQSFELSAVRRVDAHGDRILDGAIKGAIFGGVLGAIVAGPRFAWQPALAYSLIGAGIDAMNRCYHTVYRAPATKAAVTISW